MGYNIECSTGKTKNIMPSGRFLLRQEDSEYRRNTSGMWKGERTRTGAPEEKDESVKSEQTSETRKKQ